MDPWELPGGLGMRETGRRGEGRGVVSEMKEMSGAKWTVSRFVPVMVLCAVCGAVLGIFRADACALPGLAGMLAGGVAGYGAGRLGRGDPLRFWAFGQRLWLAFAGALIYGWVQLLVAGAVHATPVDSPFYWISEVADGFLREPFFSMGQTGGVVLRAYSGTLTGGWWIFFNLLDAVLFAFLFLVSTGAGLFPDEKSGAEKEVLSGAGENDNGGDGERENDNGDDDEREGESTFEVERSPSVRAEPCGLVPEAPSRLALLGFVVVLLLLFGGSALARYVLDERFDPATYHPESLQELQRLAEGRWRFDAPDGVLLRTEKDLDLFVQVSGYGSLTAVTKGDTPFRLSLDKRGRRFTGLLYPLRPGTERVSSMPLSARLHIASDGSELHLAVTLFTIRGRLDPVLRAVRMDSSMKGP